MAHGQQYLKRAFSKAAVPKLLKHGEFNMKKRIILTTLFALSLLNINVFNDFVKASTVAFMLWMLIADIVINDVLPDGIDAPFLKAHRVELYGFLSCICFGLAIDARVDHAYWAMLGFIIEGFLCLLSSGSYTLEHIKNRKKGCNVVKKPI